MLQNKKNTKNVQKSKKSSFFNTIIIPCFICSPFICMHVFLGPVSPNQ